MFLSIRRPISSGGLFVALFISSALKERSFDVVSLKMHTLTLLVCVCVCAWTFCPRVCVCVLNPVKWSKTKPLAFDCCFSPVLSALMSILGSVQLGPILGRHLMLERGSLVFRDVQALFWGSVIPISGIYTPHLTLMQDILVVCNINIL